MEDLGGRVEVPEAQLIALLHDRRQTGLTRQADPSGEVLEAGNRHAIRDRRAVGLLRRVRGAGDRLPAVVVVLAQVAVAQPVALVGRVRERIRALLPVGHVDDVDAHRLVPRRP